VMGGRTSRSRDAHMKDLLNRSLNQLASSRPPIAVVKLAQDNPPVPVFKPGTEPVGMVVMNDVAPKNKPIAANDNYVSNAETNKQAVRRIVNGGWGIQVGAFSESRDAFMAAVHAMNLATRELQGSEITVIDPNGSSNRVYRARIANISEVQARRACRVLLSHKEACFVYQDTNG
ncbi:MAG: hypothetical protein MK052_00990, partial [Alphaproteobacteria bacterium]|nr:hypothetical protein [Alphaproteobacteria bacterium]